MNCTKGHKQPNWNHAKAREIYRNKENNLQCLIVYVSIQAKSKSKQFKAKEKKERVKYLKHQIWGRKRAKQRLRLPVRSAGTAVAFCLKMRGAGGWPTISDAIQPCPGVITVWI